MEEGEVENTGDDGVRDYFSEQGIYMVVWRRLEAHS